MTHLTLVHSKPTHGTPFLAPEIPPSHTKLSAAQQAKVSLVATRLASQFRVAAIDYFERRASYSATVPALQHYGVLDRYFDPIIESVTFESVLLDVQARALDHMRETLRSEAKRLLALADAPLS
jgi:hypothetical protein